MKLKGLIAAPLVAVLATALSAAPPADLPEGWVRTGDASTDDCKVTAETVANAPTPKAFVMECAKGAKGFVAIAQSVSARDYAGKRVRLAARVKGVGLGDWAGVWMRGDASNKSSVAFDNMGKRPLRGSFDWQSAEVVLDMPAETGTLVFGVLLRGSGRLETTQFTLDVVPQTVATTAAALPPRPVNLTPQ